MTMWGVLADLGLVDHGGDLVAKDILTCGGQAPGLLQLTCCKSTSY